MGGCSGFRVCSNTVRSVRDAAEWANSVLKGEEPWARSKKCEIQTAGLSLTMDGLRSRTGPHSCALLTGAHTGRSQRTCSIKAVKDFASPQNT